MKTYHLNTKQFLPISLEEAWDFFSDPKNLAKITPPDMGFVIRSGAEMPMFEGQIINYTVKPLLGIPTKWVTKITEVVPKKYFVDEQAKGPYKLWRHKHSFKEVEGGIEMMDELEYALPFGILGRIAHAVFIRSRLKQIFGYREKVLRVYFGELQMSSTPK